MFEVMTGLFLGTHQDALDVGARRKHGIKAVLTVMNDELEIPKDGALCLRVSCPDGPGFTAQHLDECLKFLDLTYESGLPTLIHCWSGHSRSVAVVSLYIRICGRLTGSLEDIALSIQRARRHEETLPNAAVWAVVKEYLSQCQRRAT